MVTLSRRRRFGTGTALAAAGVVLYLRVLGGILAEYSGYFPADFEQSAFLSGKRFVFEGGYAAAFYAHVISGPVVSGLALFLLWSGGRPALLRAHRLAGRALATLVLAVLVPSGLVMARQAYAGPVAGGGFAALAVATASYMAATVYFARRKSFYGHQRFAMGTFVLLASPLVLRLAAGVAIVTGLESEAFYQVNAWVSWVGPLVAYEGWMQLPEKLKRPLLGKPAVAAGAWSSGTRFGPG